MAVNVHCSHCVAALLLLAVSSWASPVPESDEKQLEMLSGPSTSEESLERVHHNALNEVKRFYNNMKLSRGTLSKLSSLFKEHVNADTPTSDAAADAAYYAMPKSFFDSYLLGSGKAKRFYGGTHLSRDDLAKISTMFKSQANTMDQYAALPNDIFEELFKPRQK